MKMPGRKQGLLLMALTATLALAIFAPGDDGAAGGVAIRRSTATEVTGRPAGTPAAAGQDWLLPRAERGTPGDDVPDLFQRLSWHVPPPPAPPSPPAPPTAPMAPPLPFTFLGQLVEDGPPQVMLVRGERLITVRVGADIDNNYRLEGFRDGLLTFVYRPLDTRQTLNTGSLQ